MPGKKVYSTYYDTAFRGADAKAKKELLEKVFNDSDNPFLKNGYDYEVVKNAANKFLAAITAERPGVQEGDSDMFPNGVHLDYQGFDDANIPSPDVSAVKWENAGDPATPYIPDIRSPGNPELIPQDEAPELTNEDIKPNYVPAQGLPPLTSVDKGTYNPAITGPAIHKSAAISVDEPLPMGQSIKPGV